MAAPRAREAQQAREDEYDQRLAAGREEQWRAAGAMGADDPWWDEAARQDAERKRQDQILHGN